MRAAGKHRRRRDEAGAVAVEFAIVALTVFPVLYAILLPLGNVYGKRLALERNVGQAARWGALVTNGSRGGVADTVRGRATAPEIVAYATKGSYAASTVTVTCNSSSTSTISGVVCQAGNSFSNNCATQTSLTVTQTITTDYGPIGALLRTVGRSNSTFQLTSSSTVCKE